MIDPEVEQLVPVNKVPKKVEEWMGESHSVSTIYRWMNDGVRGVKLEWMQAPGFRCTSVQALKRFFARLSGDIDDPGAGAGASVPTGPRPAPASLGVRAQRKVEAAVQSVLASSRPKASPVPARCR